MHPQKVTGAKVVILIAFCVIMILAFCLLFHPVQRWIREAGKSNDFRLEISEPIVVAQQEKSGDNSWGYFQFPRMCYTENGNILMRVANKKDSMATYSGEYLYYISEDHGQTWRECNEADSLADFSLLMDNGCYYQGPVLLDTSPIDGSLNDMVPYFTAEDKRGRHDLYWANEITTALGGYTATEFDPRTGNENQFETSYVWDERPIVVTNGLLVPNNRWLYSYKMHTPNSIIKEKDGSLFAAVYGRGGEKGDASYIKDSCMYNVFFLRSNDNGRTWSYVAEILSQGICAADSDGFGEPCLTVAPDGRYCVLIRSGAGYPCYFSYSLDEGQSWSEPIEFDDVGVDPQLLTLDCGVTLASYGRPGIYLRATDDPGCVSWNDPTKITLSKETANSYVRDSCCYTSLIQIDEYTALLAYSDFNYPSLTDPDETAKTILIRKVHIDYGY